MKKIVTFFAVLALINTTFSQNNWCRTSEADRLIKENSTTEQLAKRTEIETIINAQAQARFRNGNTRSGEKKIIPVVVHIIHDNGQGDISDVKVHDVIRTLNEDYRRLNMDSTETREVFKSVAGSTGFEFRLATIDPQGNNTTGITRSSSSLTNNADDAVKSVSYWNSNKYFNIWAVRSIEGGGGGGIILGYAQFPTSWGGGINNTYGLVIRSDEMKYGNRTITHEVGHCFGLYHTFQSGCGSSCEWSGDEICDTPPTEEATYFCETDQNTCTNDISGSSSFSEDVVDQIENYMSYDGDCQNMFSKGQIIRMEEVVNSVEGLISLTSEENSTETGVNELLSVDFIVNRKIICLGEYTTLIDKSVYGEATSWEVTGSNNSSITGNGNYENIQPLSPGLYDVSLNVSNGTQSLSKNKMGELFVLGSVGSPMPFSESFENEETLPSDKWMSGNLGNDTRKWEVTTEATYSGSKAIKLANLGSNKGNVDVIYSNSIDLSPMQTTTLKMKVAYAQVGSSNDKLEVWSYKNCGADSMPMGSFPAGANLAGSNTSQDDDFIPTSTSQWKEFSFNVLSSTYLAESFMFKIKFVSDSGNNVFIDDINLTGTYKSIPVLQSPSNGHSSAPDNVKLDWKAVADIDEYEYQLDTTNMFNSSLLQTGTKTYISTDPYNEDTQFETSDLLWGKTYYWRVRAITAGVTSAWSTTWDFKVSENGVGIKESDKKTELSVVPNPVLNEALLNLFLKKGTELKVSVINLLGQQQGSTLNLNLLPGNNNIQLKTSHLAEGIYFVVVDDGFSLRVEKFIKK